MYPGIIVRHTGLSMIESYEILNNIERLGIIERVFQYDCPRCDHIQIYESLSDVEVEIYCKNCGYNENENIYEPRNILQALQLIFRVIKE